MTLELVANVWPVVDRSGFVLRFLARAYAMDAPDATVSSTLRALAPTDFRMAHVFRIPQGFRTVSEEQEIRGCVPIRLFHENQSDIVEPALRALESGFAHVQGIREVGADGALVALNIMPRFPRDPYVVVTVLLETEDGLLIPQVPS